MASERERYPTPWGATEIPPQIRVRGTPGSLSTAPDPRPSPMCARCRVVLASTNSPDVRLWFHPPTAPAEDHEPKPVRQTQEAWRSVCDACGESSAGGFRFWTSVSRPRGTSRSNALGAVPHVPANVREPGGKEPGAEPNSSQNVCCAAA
jgi:hypothetical protein